ncbi:MAG TPA: cation:proton antiporter [Sedimentisphaerales bacterium]|nr:cation:proton antiporter [Sedimentisphaerales bacterium]
MAGLTFLIMFLLLIALTAIVPQILRRFHVPGVVSILLIGILIGPNGIDLIRKLNHFLGRGYPTDQLYLVVEAMGLLGLVFLMALAGMEVNLRILLSEKRVVGWLSLLTFSIPALAGYFVYSLFEPQDGIGKWVYASLFASHSVGIVFPIIRELKVMKTRFGVAVLASTVITDIASLILLAVCIQLKRHQIPSRVAGSISIFDHIDPTVLGPWFIVTFIAVVLAYIGLSLWLVPVAARTIFDRLHPHDDTRLTFFLMGVLVVVFLGELIGVSIIVGAFIAGMAVVRAPAFHDKGHILHKKIEGAGHGVLIPFLFLTIGMKTDMRILFSAWENSAIVLATVAGLVVSKVGSGWLAMWVSGFTHKKGLCAGLMTVPQLSATLAAAAVALELDMIRPEFFNGIVCLSIATTIPVPMLVHLLITKGNIQFDEIQDIQPETIAEIELEDELA